MNALVISHAGPSTTSAASHPAFAGQLRLTRRGRLLLMGLPALVVTTVLAVSLLALLLGTLASPANAATKGNPGELASYAAPVTVLQGQNLWTIAAASDPTRDVRDVIADIAAMNDLGNGVLQAGQRLYVPLAK